MYTYMYVYIYIYIYIYINDHSKYIWKHNGDGPEVPRTYARERVAAEASAGVSLKEAGGTALKKYGS